MMKRLSVPVILLSACAGLAAGLPPLTLPEGVGVNIHFTGAQPGELEQIAAAGCKFVRMDFTWAATERAPGQFDFSAYDLLVETLRKNGLRALLILDYSNPLYAETVSVTNRATGQVRSETASPGTPRAITGFARWAAAAAQHFKGRDVIWEIWNEPNIDFWKPRPKVEDYAMLVSSTCSAMRAMDPAATILAPASSEFPWEFLEKFCQSGALGYLDGFSVHPYREPSRPPESAGADYQKLRTLLDHPGANRGRQRLPIISGEWGYSTARGGVSPEVQADFLVRQQLFNLLHEIPLSIWYDWKNDGTNPQDKEHNFGIVTHDRQPKPAYTALQIMTRELAGYRIARRVDTGNERVFVLLMAKSGDSEKLAAWTIGDAETISLAVEVVPGKTARPGVCNIRGETYQPKLKDGKLSIEISGTPQFVTLVDLSLRPSPSGNAPEKK